VYSTVQLNGSQLICSYFPNISTEKKLEILKLVRPLLMAKSLIHFYNALLQQKLMVNIIYKSSRTASGKISNVLMCVRACVRACVCVCVSQLVSNIYVYVQVNQTATLILGNSLS